MRPFLSRQGDRIRLAGKIKRRCVRDSLLVSVPYPRTHVGGKQPPTAAEDLQPRRVLQHARKGDLGPGCTPPFRSPSANSSRGASDSNPNPNPNPGSPTRAVRPSKSSAGIMAMSLLSGPRRPGNTVICKMWRDQGCSKVCVPKTPTPRHQTGLTLAEDGLGSGGTPSAARSPPQPQHGTQLPASESGGGRRSKWWEPHLLLISSLFGGIQASPEAECPLHLVCHYTIAWRGKGRARGAREQGGLRQQPGPAEIFFRPCHFTSLAHMAPPEHP